MSFSLKDRFRYVESSILQPCSKTLQALMESHAIIKEQYSYLRKHEQMLGSLFIFSSKHMEDISHGLFTLHSFFNTLLLSKRQQLLLSACWEQFLVLTMRDYDIIYLACGQFISHIMDDVKEDTSTRNIDVINETMRFLEVEMLTSSSPFFTLELYLPCGFKINEEDI